MEKILEEFPIPEEEQNYIGAGAGAWDGDFMEAWLYMIRGLHPWFEYEWNNRRNGWEIICPGNTEHGWTDGARHSSLCHHTNESTLVRITNGIPCLLCRHAHCCDGAPQGRKHFRDLLNYFDPSRSLSEYPAVDHAAWLREMETNQDQTLLVRELQS
jgi:hypothetical protein